MGLLGHCGKEWGKERVAQSLFNWIVKDSDQTGWKSMLV